MSRTLTQRIVYRVAQRVVQLILKLWCGVGVKGAEHVPVEGPCIIAANHASFLDPPLLTSAIPQRRIRFMARDTLFSNRFATWFFNAIQIIPVDRDRGDVAAMKSVLRALSDGQTVGLFPEGTRTFDGTMQDAKRGIGFMIMRAGVSVVPVYLDGTYEAYPRGARRVKRTKVRAFIGAPIPFEEMASSGKGKEAYAAAAELVMSRIRALKP